MLDFLRRDFPQYAWSIRTLDRRIQAFDIKRTDVDVTVDQVKSAVQKELDGPKKMGLANCLAIEPCIKKSGNCITLVHQEILFTEV